MITQEGNPESPKQVTQLAIAAPVKEGGLVRGRTMNSTASCASDPREVPSRVVSIRSIF